MHVNVVMVVVTVVVTVTIVLVVVVVTVTVVMMMVIVVVLTSRFLPKLSWKMWQIMAPPLRSREPPTGAVPTTTPKDRDSYQNQSDSRHTRIVVMLW